MSRTMRNPGTRSSAAELLIRLDRTAPVPLRAQLEDGFRELIRAGRLQAGAVLPSTRALAADLRVSRRLVVEAYQQLTAEGYLAARERSVTRVGNVSGADVPQPEPQQPPPRYDLRPGVPALAEFPRSAWLSATAQALRHTPGAALGYPDPRGTPALRTAIATYLRRVRAVAADPQQVVICAGFTQALSLLTWVLGAPVVALEDPGLIGRDRIVAAAGGSHTPIPVDELGARTSLLPGTNADVMVVTPAHQFPLGVTLAPARRSQLLSWAAQDGRLVIEDDYDAEFRYDRQPVGALQGLVPERVAYVGTTSKTLAPGLRLGWMVLPCGLLEAVTQAKRDHDAGSPVLDQMILAHLFDSGVYERHLRRARRQYRLRRNALIAALREHLPAATVGGVAAGLHLVLTLPGDLNAAVVVEAAGERGLALTALDRYLLPESAAATNRLVLGYGNIGPGAIGAATRRLAEAITAAGP
jgi:GntR family transcriptional regulator / MocR family aminotransferase